MPRTAHWVECFTGPERRCSKTRRIQNCLLLQPLLYLLPQLLGKRHNILVMGRACSLRVPVSEANDLNYLLGVTPVLLVGSHDKTIECATAFLSRTVGQYTLISISSFGASQTPAWSIISDAIVFLYALCNV
jgi:hypothetical protein